jgi:hypothetical protein
MDEDGMDSEEIEEDEDVDVDALVARVTIVFEGGHAGVLPEYVLTSITCSCALTNFCERYKFKDEPDVLRLAVLYP